MRYNTLNGVVRVDRDSFFVMAETSRTRGHSMKLYKPTFSGLVLLIYEILCPISRVCSICC